MLAPELGREVLLVVKRHHQLIAGAAAPLRVSRLAGELQADATKLRGKLSHDLWSLHRLIW